MADDRGLMTDDQARRQMRWVTKALRTSLSGTRRSSYGTDLCDDRDGRNLAYTQGSRTRSNARGCLDLQQHCRGVRPGTHDELLAFLYYALGSAGEVRSMLLLIERLTLSDALRPHVADLIAISRSVSRQLGAWIESLKNSHIAAHGFATIPHVRLCRIGSVARVSEQTRTHQGSAEGHHDRKEERMADDQ